MKLTTLLCLLLSAVAFAQKPATQPTEKIKVLVITGGHGFQPEPFFKMFKDNPEIEYTAAGQAKAAEAYDRDDLYSFNVIVLYDSPSEITDSQKQKFLGLFDRGIGVVVLHHAYLSYQKWPEYERIAGGKYALDDTKVGAEVIPSSNYKQPLDFPVTVVDKQHPINAGIEDFTLHDELYYQMRMGSDIHPLWKTGDEVIAWTRAEKNSRIVGTIQGHGSTSYTNPNYLKFLYQSIRWAAKR